MIINGVAYAIIDGAGNVHKGVVDELTCYIEIEMKDEEGQSHTFAKNLFELYDWCYARGWKCRVENFGIDIAEEKSSDQITYLFDNDKQISLTVKPDSIVIKTNRFEVRDKDLVVYPI